MLYDVLRDLPVEIDRVETELLSFAVSPEFTRKTTVVHLHGAGHEGVGEDVTYAGEEHEGDRSARLDALELFPGGEPAQHAYLDYRRWAFESAALDLALRQAGRSLGDAIGRETRPVRFVSSTRATALEPWLELYP